MERKARYIIRFDDLEPRDAGQAAESLQRTLLDAAPDIEAQRLRSDRAAMDFGNELAVVLTAPAIIELARGISAWLGRTHSSKVTITRSDGTIIVDNIGARQAVDLAQRLQTDHDYGR